MEAGAGLAVVAVCSVPAIVGFVSQLRSPSVKENFYEDKDGNSTPEANATFSNRWPKVLIVLLAALGSASSLAVAILSTVDRQDVLLADGLLSAAWILLVVQAACIAATHDSVHAYNVGLWAWVSSLVLGLVLLIQGTSVLTRLLPHHPISFALRILTLVAVLGFSATSVSLARRPDVYLDGALVDRMYTVPAYSRFTFSWCDPLIKTAREKKDLEVVDLPRPGHTTRASDISARWKTVNQNANSALWLRVLWFFRWAVLAQWSLALFRSFVSFVPYWVTLQILRALEKRQSGTQLDIETWLLVFWLGFSILADAWLSAVMFWVSWSELLVPVRNLLSAIIVEKSMRRKNVKSVSKSDTDTNTDTNTDTDAEADGESTNQGKPGDDEDEDGPSLKSQQAIVNLIGVDAKRVSDFAAYQLFFPSSIARFVIGICFLVSLLGWIPVLAGLGALALITPLNIYFTKLYTGAQDRLMKLRDQKLALVNECLLGMRQIKFSALEAQWGGRIHDMREKELKAIWDAFKADSALYGSWVGSPIALAAASLSVYALIHGSLTPSVAFVSISVFKSLELALSILPELTTDLIDAKVSIGRIEEFTKAPEITQIVTHGDGVSFEGADIAWPADDEETDESERFVLRNVTAEFPSGELSVVSGKTGAGKSLLLAAILGEADLLSGKIYVPKPPSTDERHDDKANRGNWILPTSIAFVAQIPWIENATLRDNILFGLPLDEDRYSETIRACALQKDLDMLTDGDQTELGANGVNLSGGQKWRVTLARAVYSRAGILILDDIFSAVDAHVGRHIFEKCLTGPLCKGRTRILVTHHVGLCAPKTNFVLELGDGTVQRAVRTSEMDGDDDTLRLIEQDVQPQRTGTGTGTGAEDEDGEPMAMNSEAGGSALQKVPSKAARQFIEEESKEQGAIKKHVYAAYLRDSGGWSWWTMSAFFFIAFEAMTLGRSWWLRIWTGNNQQEALDLNAHDAHNAHGAAYAASLQHTMHHVPPNPVHITEARSVEFYLGIYVAISAAAAVLGVVRMLFLFVMSLKASRRIFHNMTYTVLRAPLRWLDTVPVGRILNRFTADFNIIDSRIAVDIALTLNSVLSVVGICIAAIFVSPYIILLAFALLLACVRVAVSYLDAARPSKRLESTTKSPIFEVFGSALAGVTTIRGFDKANTYVQALYTKTDDYGMATWYLWLFNRWMGWRMSILGAIFSVVVAIMILGSSRMDAALAGFTLSFALEFSESVLWAIRNYASIELDMNAAERVVEYAELPTEDQGGEDPPATWPSEGRLEINDLVVSYADDLPPVLKGLTFHVEGKERVGVVGRTGAGKSSLTLAIFRFLEARSGTIHVDGVDVAKIKLQQLRSRLAIIPQDPVLFSGTVRFNLDPFDERTDDELYEALRRVHLLDSSPGTPPPGESSPSSSSSSSSSAPDPAPEPATPTPRSTNTNPFRSLSSPVAEGGLNLSQGQRQLLCLARAILSRPKVMVLDEATSAVDMATDALIQRSIREEFMESTLLVIAHRLSTIADFDRILVLSEGQVAEFGAPRELWEKGEGGVFRGMCEESGEKEKLKDILYGSDGK
ncbi:ATP-dependent bile acid permease [Sodiomyces alkalinus F11]|uniref:ATP-dependent bile acid permease n=1 Tax=Sodiomyces alkalinus (strain CBS 110278 / VKM F-3762 / F11) TaxID=1314773 RepID=A0A3N2PXV5_SODAK|nr:ATP-dependent bile acid permease [Sodiomyces alkalinus F11]ROT39327.1 ATP-dependent bile acid permease [Sodiomyces alkalinus F11]